MSICKGKPLEVIYFRRNKKKIYIYIYIVSTYINEYLYKVYEVDLLIVSFHFTNAYRVYVK
jgi:hypothetical protein